MSLKLQDSEKQRIWFTSDQHLFHDNIIRLVSRPFDNVDVMGQTILDNLNAVVRPQDVLFSLGDYVWEGSVQWMKDNLNCKNIYSCVGNHDSEPDLRKVFGPNKVRDIWHIKVNDQPIVLCHYRMDVWDKSHYGSWHLWGHSHTKRVPPGAHDDNDHKFSVDVGVDYWDYKPVSFDQLKTHFEFKKEMIKKRIGMAEPGWIARTQ